MIRNDRRFAPALEHAVGEAERGTAAELIVVVASRSGSYLDVALASGGVAALAVLIAALFVPAVFRPAAVALEVPLVFGLAAWLAHRTPPWLRLLTPAARQREQVDRAAAARFLAEAVHGTRARTGLLVYVSLLEEQVSLVPDLGLEGRVPRTAWPAIRPRTEADVLDGIRAIGVLLRAHVPGDAADVNESPDAPRMLL